MDLENVGVLDRFIRLIVGEVALAFTVAGWLPLWCAAFGVLALTAIFGFCPLYAVLGVSTCSTEGHHA